MPSTVITRKGQITIPKEVRNALNLRIGDKVEVVAEGNMAILRPLKKKPEEVFGKLHDSCMRPATVEEMDEAIQRKVREEWEKSESS